MSLISNHPQAGWLYLLENQHMQAVKVGKTDRNPRERADELSKATGVPGQFVVSHSWRVINSSKAEKLAHGVLKEYRIPGGEFFKVPAAVAVAQINRVVGQGAGPVSAPSETGRGGRTFWGWIGFAAAGFPLACLLFWMAVFIAHAFTDIIPLVFVAGCLGAAAAYTCFDEWRASG